MKFSYRLVLLLFLSGITPRLLGGGIDAGENLIKNPGLEEAALRPWEWYVENGADTIGEIDSRVKHSGKASFRMAKQSPFAPQVYGALRQTIENVTPKTTYIVRAWVKAEDCDGCVMILGRKWDKRVRIPAGTTDWIEISGEYTTEADESELQVVFIADRPTKNFWIDDVTAAPASARAQAPIVFESSLSTEIPADGAFYPVFPVPVASAPLLRLGSSDAPGLAANVRMAGTVENLVLEIEVSTAFTGASNAGEQMWRGDSIQLGIDAAGSSAEAQQANVAFELGFTVLDDGQVAGFAWNGTFDFTGVRKQGSRTPNGFRLELAIPWRSLSLDPLKPAGSFGINLVVNNGDLRGRRLSVEWTSGLMKTKDFSQFARAVITQASHPYAALVKVDRAQYERDDLLNGFFIETAREDLPGDVITVALEGERSKVSQPLLEATLPACPAGQTRLTRFQIPTRLISEDGDYFCSVAGKNTEGRSSVFGCFDIDVHIQRKLAKLQAAVGEFRADTRPPVGAGGMERRQLGLAVIDRFIARIGRAAIAQGAKWDILQLDECEQVLARLKEDVSRDGIAEEAEPLPASPFLYGYLGWDQLRKDIADLPQFGTRLIQQEIGPRALRENMELDPGWREIAETIDRAGVAGIKTDVLLSPHYFPQWALSKEPDIALTGATGFIKDNIAYPLHRQVIEKWLNAFVPLVKDKPGLFSFCLSNEPTYSHSGRDPHSRQAWIAFLEKKHGNIASLNGVYGSNYSSFAEVPVPVVGDAVSPAEKSAYFDWIVFNQDYFADWHAWMNSIVKGLAPSVPTHIKIMANIFDPTTLARGVDPEKMCDITDIAGNDCWAYPGRFGEYAYNWQLEEMWYDLLHSFKGQPVFNSENHLIPDNSPPVSIPSRHTRTVLWQGALHHQQFTVLWVWSGQEHPDLVGNISLRPANLFAAGEAIQDIQRLGKQVQQISGLKPRVALLYSMPSIFWQPGYIPALSKAYASLTFSGQPVTFISETQLATGRTSPANEAVEWIILPEATHVTDGAIKGLETFVKQGGKVAAVGSSPLAFDEYGRKRKAPEAVPISATIPSSLPERDFRRDLTKALEPEGLVFARIVDHSSGELPWGVEYRVAIGDGVRLTSLTNLGGKTQKLALPTKGATTDLLTGRSVDPQDVVLEPMETLLLQTGERAETERNP